MCEDNRCDTCKYATLHYAAEPCANCKDSNHYVFCYDKDKEVVHLSAGETIGPLFTAEQCIEVIKSYEKMCTASFCYNDYTEALQQAATMAAKQLKVIFSIVGSKRGTGE